MIINCDFCSKEFKTFPNWYKRNKYHCCSRECSSNLKIKLNTKECKFCNKKFSSKSHQKHRLFCSRKCFSLFHSGENSHFFNPNKEIDIRYREDTNFKLWSREIKLRDNNTCQKCGCTSKKELQAHHIVELSKNQDLRFDISNGITLCIKCHAQEHKEDSRIYNLILSHYKRINNGTEMGD